MEQNTSIIYYLVLWSGSVQYCDLYDYKLDCTLPCEEFGTVQWTVFLGRIASTAVKRL